MFNVRLPKSLKSLCFLELDRAVFPICFFAPGSSNPLESLERRLSEVRKITFGRNFSSLPAERERRSTPGRHRRTGSGAGWPSGIRRVEPDGVRPSSRLAHGAAHRMAARRRRAGERDGRNGPARSPAWFFVCFFFRGVSAGRGRRTSGVDGADIGRRSRHVKEKYRKKEIFSDSARRNPPYGACRAARIALPAVRPFAVESWMKGRVPVRPFDTPRPRSGATQREGEEG